MIFVDANDVQYTPSEYLTFDDVHIIPQYSNIPSRNDPSISMACQLTSRTAMTLPIVSSNMDTVTEGQMFTTMFNHGGYGILHRFYASKYGTEGFNRFMSDIQRIAALGCKPAFSVGISSEEITVIQKVLEVAPQGAIVKVDVAHGHTKQCVQQCRRLREVFKDQIEIIGGNVATPEGAVELAFNGQVDSICIGIGPGGNCSTRIVTGHGVPQLTAIIKVREAINKMRSNVSLIADGGIRNSGDIVKALAAGADCVMVGSIISCTTETPTELTPEGNRIYRGMSSAMVNQELGKKVAAEGVHVYRKDRGSVKPILEELAGGIRSGMTYSGARTLKQLSEKAKFIRVTQSGQREAIPHGLLDMHNV